MRQRAVGKAIGLEEEDVVAVVAEHGDAADVVVHLEVVVADAAEEARVGAHAVGEVARREVDRVVGLHVRDMADDEGVGARIAVDIHGLRRVVHDEEIVAVAAAYLDGVHGLVVDALEVGRMRRIDRLGLRHGEGVGRVDVVELVHQLVDDQRLEAVDEAAVRAEIVDEAGAGGVLLEPEGVIAVGAKHGELVGLEAAAVVHRDGGGAGGRDVDEIDVRAVLAVEVDHAVELGRCTGRALADADDVVAAAAEDVHGAVRALDAQPVGPAEELQVGERGAGIGDDELVAARAQADIHRLGRGVIDPGAGMQPADMRGRQRAAGAVGLVQVGDVQRVGARA